MKKKIFCLFIMITLLLTAIGCSDKSTISSSKSTAKVEYKTQDRFYFITKNKSEIISPNDLCKKYYKNAKDDILDKSTDFITNAWKQPVYNLKLTEKVDGKDTEKSIWIYNVSKDSPSCLYLFIEDNKVKDYSIDELNMLDESMVKMWFEKFNTNK